MRPYEVVIIIDAALEDDLIQASVERATKLLTEKGATVNGVDRWGKRRFAYELDHKWEGYYVLVHVSSEPPALTELDRMLLLADEVLRHKVIRLPKEALAGARKPRPAPEAPAEADTAAPDAIGA
jgi:small subunit ribosomal protein S6